MGLIDDAWDAAQGTADDFHDWNNPEELEGAVGTGDVGDTTEEVLENEGGYTEEEAADAVDQTNVGTIDLGDTADYVGDVIFVRDDESTDRFDAKDWLTSQTWFDAIWEGHSDDIRDLPGSNLWGTEDSFFADPSQATSDTLNDIIAFFRGDFDYTTPDGSGEGTPEGYGLPWKWIIGGGIIVTALSAVSYSVGQLFDYNLN